MPMKIMFQISQGKINLDLFSCAPLIKHTEQIMFMTPIIIPRTKTVLKNVKILDNILIHHKINEPGVDSKNANISISSLSNCKAFLCSIDF